MLAVNPFVNAYLLSDWFGKGIFWALFLLSVISWSVLLYKIWQIYQVRKISSEFFDLFSEKKDQPLHFQFNKVRKTHLLELPDPFFEIYKAVKQNALQMLDRNHVSNQLKELSLSLADLNLINLQSNTTASTQCRSLETNLFILSTTATLGPFLGLLGTIWGILLTFSQMPHGLSTSNPATLGGLSMALATTVVGLVVAIPALVGYNYLKNANREYRRELEQFMHFLLASIEIQYRKE